MPDLERWYGRPCRLGGGRARCSTGDEEGIDRASGAAPAEHAARHRAHAPPRQPSCSRAQAAVRWLREALDIYENGGCDARRGPRPAGAPRRGRPRAAAAPSPRLAVPDELADGGCHRAGSRGAAAARRGLAERRDRRSGCTSRCARSRRTCRRCSPSCDARNRAQLATVACPFASVRTRSLTDATSGLSDGCSQARSVTKEAHMTETAVFDPTEMEQFAGSAHVDLRRLDAELHDRHRSPHRAVHRRCAGSGDEPGARRSGRTPRSATSASGSAAMVTGSIFDYDPATVTYTLPPRTPRCSPTGR